MQCLLTSALLNCIRMMHLSSGHHQTHATTCDHSCTIQGPLELAVCARDDGSLYGLREFQGEREGERGERGNREITSMHALG